MKATTLASVSVLLFLLAGCDDGPAPDLVVSNVEATWDVTDRFAISATVTAEIANVGNEGAGAFMVYFDANEDPVSPNRRPQRSYNVPGLAEGASLVLDPDFGPLAHADNGYLANVHSVTVRVDPKRMVAESNERNNVKEVVYTEAKMDPSGASVCQGDVTEFALVLVDFAQDEHRVQEAAEWSVDPQAVVTLAYQPVRVRAESVGEATVEAVVSAETQSDIPYGATATIQVQPRPTACFTSNPLSPCEDASVSFSSSCSTGNPTSYSWSFGDGGSSSDADPSYVYANPGDYTVMLTVSNTCGSDSESSTIQVQPRPTACFTSNPLSPCEDASVSFSSSCSTGNPTSYSWSFGDGGSSSDADPSYVYANPGDYTVMLTVSNTCGSDSESSPLTVLPEEGCFDSVVIFSRTPGYTVGDVLAPDGTDLITGIRPIEPGDVIEITRKGYDSNGCEVGVSGSHWRFYGSCYGHSFHFTDSNGTILTTDGSPITFSTDDVVFVKADGGGDTALEVTCTPGCDGPETLVRAFIWLIAED